MPTTPTTPHLVHLFLISTLLLLSSVQALFFTSPQASTIYAPAAGQLMTWHHQPGDAVVGTFILQSLEGTRVTLATNVNLNSESLVFPSSISLPSSSSLYKILIVDSNNPSFIYSSIGPFLITSFSLPSPTSSSFDSSVPMAVPMSPKTFSGLPSSGQSAAGNAPTGTQPAVSTITTLPTPTTSGMVVVVTMTAGNSSSASQLGMGTGTTRGLIPITTGTTAAVVSSAHRGMVGWTTGMVLGVVGLLMVA